MTQTLRWGRAQHTAVAAAAAAAAANSYCLMLGACLTAHRARHASLGLRNTHGIIKLCVFHVALPMCHSRPVSRSCLCDYCTPEACNCPMLLLVPPCSSSCFSCCLLATHPHTHTCLWPSPAYTGRQELRCRLCVSQAAVCAHRAHRGASSAQRRHTRDQHSSRHHCPAAAGGSRAICTRVQGDA
jgi:hypothetical protein